MTSSTYKGFKSDDKLTDKSDYHAWKMSLDLALEDQDVMDYVQGNIHSLHQMQLLPQSRSIEKGNQSKDDYLGFYS